MLTADELRTRVAEVRRRIATAAEGRGRDPAAVTLVAVTKTLPAEVARLAVAAGAVDLGENRVQEAVAKAAEVDGARWHLIGPLQRNKARAALATFSVIHTVDRAELAERLAALLAEMQPAGLRLPVLLEVNVGREPQKAGVVPEDAVALVGCVVALPQLALQGLMVIPPWADDPEASRPHFRALAELRARLEDETGVGLPQLSMGMSHDYHVAVEEGATLVRVGTALFGARS